MPIRPLNDSEGLTLIELLVAMAIGATVVLGIQAAVGAVVSVAERGRDATDGALRREAVLLAVRQWLESAYIEHSAIGPAFVGMSRDVLGQAVDRFEFFTLDPTPLVESAGQPIWVRLRVAPGDSGLVVDYREAEKEGTGKAESPLTTFQVLPEVREMDCRYLLELGDERRWFEGLSSLVGLPRAVECKFKGADGDGAEDDEEGLLLVLLPRLG